MKMWEGQMGIPVDGKGQVLNLPPATPRPCNQCPWRRKSLPGWLGPFSAEQWKEIAHSDEPIACHETILTDEDEGDWNDPHIRQCAGAAIYRRNVAKSPRIEGIAVGIRNTEEIFATPAEFIEHHDVVARRKRRAARA